MSGLVICCGMAAGQRWSHLLSWRTQQGNLELQEGLPSGGWSSGSKNRRVVGLDVTQTESPEEMLWPESRRAQDCGIWEDPVIVESSGKQGLCPGGQRALRKHGVDQ